MSIEEEGSKRMWRIVNLFCPPLAKRIPWVVAHEDQLLDLGSIARSFGLEPHTIKLNGHFISRGADLVSSSVTWKSLLSFFSARNVSTGTHGGDAIIVDGKPCKPGIKRAHDYLAGDVHNCMNSLVKIALTEPQVQDNGLHKKRRLQGGFHTSLKRNQCSEDNNMVKRLKMNQ